MGIDDKIMRYKQKLTLSLISDNIYVWKILKS